MRDGDFETQVKRVLKRLEPGELATYGEIAEEAGFPGAARAVGNLLSKGGGDLPWWRVVRADGSLAAHHREEQVRLLKSEGIEVRDGRATSRMR